MFLIMAFVVGCYLKVVKNLNGIYLEDFFLENAE